MFYQPATLMHYKAKTAWIFTILLLAIAIVLIYPNKWLIGLGVMVLPLLLLVQAIVILRAKGENSKKTFEDGEWYEDHPR